MGDRLVATILVENAPRDGLASEHGLSVHVAYRTTTGRDMRILLDFGQSDAFARNADALGIDLGAVDCAVLSHAHYDHADGMATFFARNASAPLHLSALCAENCWSTKADTEPAHYIGIRQGTLERYAQRLMRVPHDGATQIAEGVHLVPHGCSASRAVGDACDCAAEEPRGCAGGVPSARGMYLQENGALVPDAFAHEQSLVFDLADGSLAVLNSCSHNGVGAILRDVRRAFPAQRIKAYLGGLHLAHADDEVVHDVAETLAEAGVEHLYTGHCTGDRALRLFSSDLPGCVEPLHPGLTLALPD